MPNAMAALPLLECCAVTLPIRRMQDLDDKEDVCTVFVSFDDMFSGFDRAVIRDIQMERQTDTGP